MKKKILLVINPRSKIIQLALYENERLLFKENINRIFHPGIKGDALIVEIDDYAQDIHAFITKHNIPPTVVVGRGGFICRKDQYLPAGVWNVVSKENGKLKVNDNLIYAMLHYPEIEHAANLGILIAAKIAVEYGIPAYTVDPITADDYMPNAFYSGHENIERRSYAHLLTAKYSVVQIAKKMGRDPESLRSVFIHLAGSFTIAAMNGTQMVDNNIALLGQGPMTPHCTGSLPINELIKLCYSGRYTRQELEYELAHNGGWKSYLGTDDFIEICQKYKRGHAKVIAVIEATAYQVAKEIGAMAIVTGLPLDTLIFSGPLTQFTEFTDLIKERVATLCSTSYTLTEDMEIEAMATKLFEHLAKKETGYTYQLPPYLKSF